jgi:hypothetical protein
MLPMSLNCHRSVSCVPNVTSVSELSSSCLLCTHSETLVTLGTQETGRRQFRDTGNIGYTRDRTKIILVIVLSLVYPMLPVSLNWLRPVSCVPNVTNVSELSSSCVLCTQCYQEDHSETLVTLGTQETRRRQFRDTGNIGYTRDRTKTIQRHW